MDKFYTTREVAQIFKKHPGRIDIGRLESTKVRGGYLIPETEIKRLGNAPKEEKVRK